MFDRYFATVDQVARDWDRVIDYIDEQIQRKEKPLVPVVEVNEIEISPHEDDAFQWAEKYGSHK